MGGVPVSGFADSDIADWRYEVANGDTVLGLADWVTHRNQMLEEGDPCPTCGTPLRWDSAERSVYCLNDWAHG